MSVSRSPIPSSVAGEGAERTRGVSGAGEGSRFAASGFRVPRFWNNDVLCNVEGASTLIAEALMAEDLP